MDETQERCETCRVDEILENAKRAQHFINQKSSYEQAVLAYKMSKSQANRRK